MIDAHRSLRAAEVAQPDSTTNREIMAQMISKAIAAGARPPSR
jgi:hypothetical protein